MTALSFQARAASRGICTCFSDRDRCATCFDAEALRCAEAQRITLGVESNVPAHPPSPSTIPIEEPWSRHSAVRGAKALRVEIAGWRQVALHPRPQQNRLCTRHPAGHAATIAIGCPLRLRGPLRLCVKTRCATEPGT